MNKYVFPGADASLPLGWVVTQVCHYYLPISYICRLHPYVSVANCVHKSPHFRLQYRLTSANRTARKGQL
jgi:hypothetical protein